MKNIKLLSGMPEMSYGNPSPVCYIGAAMRLLEYLGDPIEQDELIALSGVGLCFPWKFNSDCDEVSVIPDIPSRTFGALGYESEYYAKDADPECVRTKEFYISKIEASINAGRPVIGFGLVTDVYSCLITGCDGDALTVSSYQTDVVTTSDWYDKCRGILVVGEKTGERLRGAAAYKCVTDWAGRFRAARSRPVTANGVTYPQNEAAFTAMCEWLLDDNQWHELTSHELFLKQSGLLLAGYYRSNLYSYLKRLDAEFPGVVNPPALRALDDMSKLFPGSHASDLWLRECVDPAIVDFAMLRDRSVREKVERYVTKVSVTDNRVQWALFMPDFIKKQIGDNNAALKSFEYLRLPAMRFVGREIIIGEYRPGVEDTDRANRSEVFKTLDAMPEYNSEFGYDLLFQHHYGKPVDVERWHGFWGRFMSLDAPVPDGFVSFDLTPAGEGEAGPPYLSQFAYSVFSGDVDALHRTEGFDSDLMYDVTRNIVLGDDVCIDYPEKYWTAEAFRNGCANPGDAYLFGVNLDIFSKGV